MTRKSRGKAKPKTSPSNRRLVIRVDLVGAKPPIWRRLEIAPELYLDQVHNVLQAAFEWTNSHLHEFELRGSTNPSHPNGTGQSEFQFEGSHRGQVSRRFGMRMDEEDWGLEETGEPETETTLGELLVDPGDELHYLYDFGDDWEHSLKLEEARDAAPGAPLARCIAGRRACPPDDSGGIWTYEWAIIASKDPSDPTYQDAVERMEWMADISGSEEWDPKAFDIKAIDQAVRDVV